MTKRDSGRPGGHSPYLVAVTGDTRSDRKHFAAAAARNTEPILEVLRGRLPGTGRALEIASGTGQHVTAFAAAFPGIVWQPSDPSPESRESIAAWTAENALANVAAPVALDMTAPDWEATIEPRLELTVCINMIHISPWAACKGLLRGAGRLLSDGGLLYLYGPFKRDGVHTAPSNAEFDRSLRSRNPEWGVRDLAEVSAEAARNGLSPAAVVEMPANNLSVMFGKGA